MVVRTTNLTHIGWTVFANAPPSYPWYAGYQDNVAVGGEGTVTLTVTLTKPGDRLKVFASGPTGGEAARDFSVMAESNPAIAGSGGEPGSTGPAAIVSKMGLGINQERFTARNHADARSVAYYQRYRDMGIRQARFYPPYGPWWGSTAAMRRWPRGSKRCRRAWTAGCR